MLFQSLLNSEIFQTTSSGFSLQFMELKMVGQCWQELSDIRLVFDDPWVLGGDFNAILAQSERNTSGSSITNIRYFKSFVSRNELIDLPWLEVSIPGQTLNNLLFLLGLTDS